MPPRHADPILCAAGNRIAHNHLDVEENLVTDPVCGIRINKAFAPAQMDYQDQTYYFCVQDCRKRFAADPARYLTGI